MSAPHDNALKNATAFRAKSNAERGFVPSLLPSSGSSVVVVMFLFFLPDWGESEAVRRAGAGGRARPKDLLGIPHTEVADPVFGSAGESMAFLPTPSSSSFVPALCYVKSPAYQASARIRPYVGVTERRIR